MKRIRLIAGTLCALFLLPLSGCDILMSSMGTTGAGTGTTGTTTGTGDILGDILGGILGGGNTTNGLLNMVIGYITIDERELYGTWSYSEPGCAFTSENLLAKAGGAVAAESVKDKLTPAYNTVGISASNTQFAFDQQGNFQARLAGLPLSGSYTYDKSKSAIKFRTTLASATGYVTRTTNGIAITFESKKLLNLLQAVSQLSGNQTVRTIGDLSKEYEGVRVGFGVRK